MTKPQVIDLKEAAKDNEAFRRVVFTGTKSQLVLMSLEPNEDIGLETHEEVDQLIYVIDGEGTAVIGEGSKKIEKGDVVCVPAGTLHNIVNTDDEPMKVFTVYSPPEHAAGTVHKTKADAAAAEQAHPALVPA